MTTTGMEKYAIGAKFKFFHTRRSHFQGGCPVPEKLLPEESRRCCNSKREAWQGSEGVCALAAGISGVCRSGRRRRGKELIVSFISHLRKGISFLLKVSIVGGCVSTSDGE